MKLSFEANAVQWFKDGDHKDVRVAGPQIRSCYDVAYINGLSPLASCWVTLKPLTDKPPVGKGVFSAMIVRFERDGGVYYRKVWPFTFFSMRGEKETRELTTSAEDQQFFADFEFIERELNKHRPEQYPRQAHGMMRPPASDGRMAVFPGDWIVEYDGKRDILHDLDFQRRFGVQT